MVNNIEDGFNLTQTTYTKKSFTAWLKKYMAFVKSHLEKNDPDRVKPFMDSAQKFVVSKVLKNFSDFDFYVTESVRSSSPIYNHHLFLR